MVKWAYKHNIMHIIIKYWLLWIICQLIYQFGGFADIIRKPYIRSYSRYIFRYLVILYGNLLSDIKCIWYLEPWCICSCILSFDTETSSNTNISDIENRGAYAHIFCHKAFLLTHHVECMTQQVVRGKESEEWRR